MVRAKVVATTTKNESHFIHWWDCRAPCKEETVMVQSEGAKEPNPELVRTKISRVPRAVGKGWSLDGGPGAQCHRSGPGDRPRVWTQGLLAFQLVEEEGHLGPGPSSYSQQRCGTSQTRINNGCTAVFAEGSEVDPRTSSMISSSLTCRKLHRTIASWVAEKST